MTMHDQQLVPLMLDTPFQLGSRLLRNRIMTAPMEKNFCRPDGRVSDHYISYAQDRAAGGVAVVGTEAAFVRPDGKGRPLQLGVHDDSMIPGLRAMAQAVHEHGALLAVELNHGGRTAQAKVSGFQPVAPSPVPCVVAGGDMPIELDAEDIGDIIRAFGAAARRCREAGVDVITLHGGHGYLILQFMSPRTNHRHDRYAEPGLFLSEVVAAVAREAGDCVISLRVSAFEGVPDGLQTPDTVRILGETDLTGVDLLDISAGSYEAGQWIIQSGEWNQGLLARTASQFRALGKPVAVAGRINSVAAAETILGRGDADLLSMGRAVHADPQWVNHARAGQEPRPCIACNYCVDQLSTGGPALCSVNPAAAPGGPREDDAALDRPSGQVLVVGAGPSGLEAALALAQRGVAVTIADSQVSIGGQLALAAKLHEYPEYGRVIDWYGRALVRVGVHLKLGVSVDAQRLAQARAQGFDGVVLATGGVGFIPDGVRHRRLVDVRDWLRDSHRVLIDARYTIWGGDREAVAVADDLVQRGASVFMVAPGSEIARDVGRRAKILVLPRLQSAERADIRLESVIVDVTDQTVRIRAANGDEAEIETDGPILVSQGVLARNDLQTAARELDFPWGARIVGDAGGAGGSVAEAVTSGRLAAIALVSALVAEPELG